MRQSVSILLLVVFFFHGSLPFAGAQSATFRGHVLDAVTGEPVSFVHIHMFENQESIFTDQKGFFVLPSVEEGTYNLLITSLGYDTLGAVAEIGAPVTYLRYQISPGPVVLSSVKISAEMAKSRMEVNLSQLSISPAKVNSFPAIGAAADVGQYLNTVPGIITTGDQGGQLFVRGGTPVQNKILLDNIELYSLSHSIGLFSPIEAHSISSINIYTGGFGAEFGGRISSVIDIVTRKGNKKQAEAKLVTNPFFAGGYISGPILPMKNERGSSLTFLFDGKYSIIDKTWPDLYPNINFGEGLPYEFRDLHGKISYQTGNGSEISIASLYFQDHADFDVAEIDWTSTGTGISLRILPDNSSVVINGSLSFSHYNSQLSGLDNPGRNSAISSFRAALDFEQYGSRHTLRYGLGLGGNSTSYELENFLGVKLEAKENNTESFAYSSINLRRGKFIFHPGLRAQYYATTSTLSIEPRIGLKYKPSADLMFKLGGGVYSQNLIAVNNERDVVNVFRGFLSSPGGPVFQPGSKESVEHKLQKSIDIIGGAEYFFSQSNTLNIEGYYKYFPQLLRLNQQKENRTAPDFLVETSESYGLELLLNHETEAVKVQTAYSFSRVTRDDGEQVFPAVYDRRHNLNFLSSYSIGRSKNFTASVRWQLGSGFPFTSTTGFYSYYSFPGEIDREEILTGNPEPGIIYSGERNDQRLPWYHRLDISLKQRLNILEWVDIEITLSATNVYDRKNVFFIDRVSYSRVDQLPFLLAAGIALQLN